MKKRLFVVYILLSVNITIAQNSDCSFSPFNVYLSDESESKSNIREKPNGDVILELDNQNEFFQLRIVDYKDGWLKTDHITTFNYGYEISKLEGWVHHSIVTAFTRKKITLYDSPSGTRTTATIDVETDIVIKDICSGWVKVQYENLSGWIEAEWLCGNPVTICN